MNLINADILRAICKDYEIWQLVSQTSNHLRTILGVYFDYYPNEPRIFIFMSGNTNNPIIGQDLSSKHFTINQFKQFINSLLTTNSVMYLFNFWYSDRVILSNNVYIAGGDVLHFTMSYLNNELHISDYNDDELSITINAPRKLIDPSIKKIYSRDYSICFNNDILKYTHLIFRAIMDAYHTLLENKKIV